MIIEMSPVFKQRKKRARLSISDAKPRKSRRKLQN